MSASLVGSEMCIRDSSCAFLHGLSGGAAAPPSDPHKKRLRRAPEALFGCCLLYTSDAADDM
eukprot:7190419-Alexandrium_andersonii.AAC.1